MKCQNNKDGAWRVITKFVWQLGRYEPSSPSTKELHASFRLFLYLSLSISIFQLIFCKSDQYLRKNFHSKIEKYWNGKFEHSIVSQNLKWRKNVFAKLFSKNGPSSASFSFIFSLFKQTIRILRQINVKNVPLVSGAGIWTHNFLNLSLLL